MRRLFPIILLAAVLALGAFATPARAADQNMWCQNSAGVWKPASPSNPCSVTATGGTGAGAFTGATVGASHAQVLAAGSRTYLLLQDVAAAGGNTVYCSFGGTATVNGAGTISVAPGQIVTWEGSFVPSDAIDCIATGASTPLTIGAH